jgi:VanZ family protein
MARRDGWIIGERLRQWLLKPTPRLRVAAAAAALFVIANLFYHGAQSYAVDAIAAPWDKLAHFTLFFVLGLLVSAALGGRRGVIVLALCALVGGTDELAQLLTPGREVDFGDWIADISGAGSAALLVHFLKTALPLSAGALPQR